MAKSFIAYDRDLPEIPGHCAWHEPDKHLVKQPTNPTGYRVETGRRPSNLLPINKLRQAVGQMAAWRLSRRIRRHAASAQVLVRRRSRRPRFRRPIPLLLRSAGSDRNAKRLSGSVLQDAHVGLG